MKWLTVSFLSYRYWLSHDNVTVKTFNFHCLQLITDVNSCIDMAHSLKEGGGGSRTAILLSNITNLKNQLQDVEHFYNQLTGSTAAPSSDDSLHETARDVGELYVINSTGQLKY